MSIKSRALRWLIACLVLPVAASCVDGPTDPSVSEDQTVRLSPAFGQWACTTYFGQTTCEWFPDCSDDPNMPECWSPPEEPGDCDPYTDPACGGGGGGGGGGNPGEGESPPPSLITRCNPPGSSTCTLTVVTSGTALWNAILAEANRLMARQGDCLQVGSALGTALYAGRISTTSTWFNASDGSGREAVGRTIPASNKTILSVVRRDDGTSRTVAELTTIARHEGGHLAGWSDVEISQRMGACV